MADRLKVEVLWRADGTTHRDAFTALKASVTMFRRGRTAIVLKRGRDAEGSVRSAQYERAYRVIVRRSNLSSGRG